MISDRLKATMNNNKPKVNCQIVRSNFAENRSCSICFGGEGKRHVCRCASRNSEIVQASGPGPKSSKRSNSFHSIQAPLNKAAVTAAAVAASSHAKATFEPQQNGINKNHNLNTSKFNFTIVISFVTLAFFCCQLPCRIFLLWSYLKHYFAPPLIQITENGEEPITVKNDLFYINLISNLSTLIYFLHCISNPIIYNILSIKFRKAFLSMTTFNKTNDCRLSFKA